MSASPPRLAAWLLNNLLDATARDIVAGDLQEEYARIRHTRGAIRASAWYWTQATRSVLACRVTGRRRADYGPVDFETRGHLTLRDLIRPAFRQFKDHPLYAFASAGTLCLAIAAACPTFVVVKRAFLDPLAYANDHELVSILTDSQGRQTAVSPHVLEDLRRSSAPFSGLAPIRPMGVSVQRADGAEPGTANLVTRDYFTVLGVVPAIGRVFQDGEPAVVVSWRFWQRTFNGDHGALGRQVIIDGQPRTIVGVMPRNFVTPYWSESDLWMPLDLAPMLADVRARRTLTILARRAPGAAQSQVDRFLATFSTELQQKYPADHARMNWVAIPLRNELIGASRQALLGTAAAAALLLLIVCANIAGLSTAHAAVLRRPLAIRTALGATRGRLFWAQLVDSTVIAAAGTIAGIWMSSGVIRIVAAYQRQFLDRLAPIALDVPTMFVAALAGLVIGVVPSTLTRGAGRTTTLESLHDRTATGDRNAMTLRSTLVMVQVALALVLIVGAGLLVRTVRHLAGLSPGFDAHQVRTFNVTLPAGAKYRSSAAQIEFERAVVERLRAIHGVTAVTSSVGFPVVGGMGAGLVIQGRPQANGLDEIGYLSMSPNFMSAMGARMIAGRDLLESDTLATPRVVVINETMARMFWADGDPVGAQVQIGAGSPNQPWITVVGVVADLSDLGPTQRVRPTAYGSTRQYTWPRRHFSVRTDATSVLTLGSEIRAAVAAVDPTIPVSAITSVDDMLADRTARHRLATLAVGVFGAVALILAAAGVYAVVALTSRLRRREYAIRMALGGARGGVRWLVIRHALVVGGAGTMAGTAAAAGATRWLEGMLHGVAPLDPTTFAIAVVSVPALAVIAAWQPARQAMRVDPVETLKAE